LIFHLLTQKLLIKLRNIIISLSSTPNLLAHLLIGKVLANLGKQINNCNFLSILMLMQDLFNFFIFFSEIKYQSLFLFNLFLSKFTQNPRLNFRFLPRHFGNKTRCKAHIKFWFLWRVCILLTFLFQSQWNKGFLPALFSE